MTSSVGFVYSPHYNLELPGHVFPAHKFKAIFDKIQKDPSFKRFTIYNPSPALDEDLILVHTESYLFDLFNYRITPATASSELPLNDKIVKGFLYGVGGTMMCMELLNRHDIMMNLGSGFHHSFPSRAEGFCYLNDVAVAIRKEQMNNPDKKFLIIDLDLHQGNGNAFIFREDPNVFTLSIHQEMNYPAIKEISDIDVGLEDGTGDEDYLSILQSQLEKVESQFKPDIVVYVAGVDPYEKDRLGKLALTINGMFRRDSTVKEFILKNKAKGLVVLAGGYAYDPEDTVYLHYQTAKVFSGV
jgi:acetoin utilization deacetylase AcuC-like enzyme